MVPIRCSRVLQRSSPARADLFRQRIAGDALSLVERNEVAVGQELEGIVQNPRVVGHEFVDLRHDEEVGGSGRRVVATVIRPSSSPGRKGFSPIGLPQPPAMMPNSHIGYGQSFLQIVPVHAQLTPRLAEHRFEHGVVREPLGGT